MLSLPCRDLFCGEAAAEMCCWGKADIDILFGSFSPCEPRDLRIQADCNENCSDGAEEDPEVRIFTTGN
jgi:hypothetical protein